MLKPTYAELEDQIAEYKKNIENLLAIAATETEAKQDRADELVIADKAKQNRADELVIADKAKQNRADELVIADKAKQDRADELVFADKAKQNRANELVIADKEKQNRADKLVTFQSERQERESYLISAEAEMKVRKEKVEGLNVELAREIVKRNGELIAANKELEAFCYSVSHDLRAPLRHISGFANLLVNEFSNSIPEDGQHYLENIETSTSQMGQLIDDLLKFSRTSRYEMQVGDVDMNNCLVEVLEPLKQEYKDRDIHWSSVELPHVNGDSHLLKLVWTNLLENAIKYTQKQQKARIQIGFQDKEAEYIFYVKDNGVGFDMKYAHKLFGVFQRMHSDKEFEGTGVGLANVRQIIEKHGGRIWADAKPDKGATFYFTFLKPENKYD